MPARDRTAFLPRRRIDQGHVLASLRPAAAADAQESQDPLRELVRPAGSVAADYQQVVDADTRAGRGPCGGRGQLLPRRYVPRLDDDGGGVAWQAAEGSQ